MDVSYCGSSQEEIVDANDEMMEKCPQSLADMNICCAVHYDCSMASRGREFCNGQLCKCMNTIIEDYPDAKNCANFANKTCHSLTHIPPLDFANARQSISSKLDIRTIEKSYDELHEKCPTQNAILQTCSTKYNTCVKRDWKCTFSLINCLNWAVYNWNGTQNGNCDDAVEDIISKLIVLNKEEKSNSNEVKSRIITVNDTKQERIAPVAEAPRADLSETMVDNQVFLFFIGIGLFVLLCIAANFASQSGV
uniref:Uncharacterized protein n=1 Tax=Caenorhabditis japonica TaxID=281687 RepID=A0A8R1EPG6_CAEJA